MKAYVIGLHSNPDAGNDIVFAENSKEAFKKAQSEDVTEGKESYIDVYAHRSPEFDGMEKCTHKEIMYQQYLSGWWFDIGNPPDYGNRDATKEEFGEWYEDTFGRL